MIEMRVIDRGFYGMEYQYRYKLPENETYYDKNMKIVEWSEWKTAPVLKEEEIKND